MSDTVIRRETPATLYGAEGNTGAAIRVDRYGAPYVNASVTSTTITEVIPGTGATDLGKAEDAVAVSGDTGVMALAVRRDTPAASGADGDYVTVNSNVDGGIYQISLTQAATFTAETSIAFGSITGSYANLLTNTARLRYISLSNQTNGVLSWDDGTTPICSGQPANTIISLDLGANGRDIRTTIRIKYVTAPTSGTAYINAYS